MDFTDPTALEVALPLLVPGFVSIKVWELLVPSERRDLTTTSLEVFAFGSITFAIFILPLLTLDVLGGWTSEHPISGYFLWLAVLFVVPAVLPIGWRRLLDTELVKGHVVNPIPKPWDYVFGKGDAYWVILHMKDGRLIGGRYETESFASSFPHEEQLYLEEVWKLSD